MGPDREALEQIARLAETDEDVRWVHGGPANVWDRLNRIHQLAQDRLDAPLQLPLGDQEDEARARRGDPSTSQAAAESVQDLRPRQKAVLACFQRYGTMTDEQLVELYRERRGVHEWPRQSESGIRTRRVELERAGHLQPVGTTRLRSGRLGTKHQVTIPRAHGEEAA